MFRMLVKQIKSRGHVSDDVRSGLYILSMYSADCIVFFVNAGLSFHSIHIFFMEIIYVMKQLFGLNSAMICQELALNQISANIMLSNIVHLT
jgi:hypothetical protein